MMGAARKYTNDIGCRITILQHSILGKSII